MKISLASVVVAFVVLMSLAPSAVAQVSSGTISSKGPFAEAVIGSTDSSGIARSIFVFGSTSTNHHSGGPPAASTFAFASYDVYDTITGADDFGFGLIDLGTLVVANKFASASLTASGTLYSYFDGSAHTVSVNLSFTPSGPSSETSYVEHFSVGPVKYVFKFSGTDQNATVSGDATIDGVDLGNFDTFFADYGSSKSSQLSISK